MWLIIRQLTMTAGWWDAPLALWDLAEAVSITAFRIWKNNIGKGGIKDFFKGGNQRRGDYLKREGINMLCEFIAKSRSTMHWFCCKFSLSSLRNFDCAFAINSCYLRLSNIEQTWSIKSLIVRVISAIVKPFSQWNHCLK